MTSQEVRNLRAACKQAREAGVFPDFRRSYRQYRMSHESVREAAWRACYDWDALNVDANGRLYIGPIFLNPDGDKVE
jgi:hypothetical protein